MLDYSNPAIFSEPFEIAGDWNRSCKHCTVLIEVCHVCKNDRPSHTFPPGQGSWDARYPLKVCELCYGKIVRAIFIAAGRENLVKHDAEGRWIE